MQDNLQQNMEITNKLLLEMVKNQKASNKNLTKVFVSTIIGYTVLVLAMIIGFFVYESQYEINDYATETEKYSIEQEASGDEAEINNVLGDQYKDNATHNEGAE